MRAWAVVAAAGWLASTPPASRAQATSASRDPLPVLHRTLDSLSAAHHGIAGYTVIDLDGGARIERRGNETFPTASLIKVGILVTLFDRIEKGELSLDDPMTVLRIDKVPGAGVLQFLHDGAVVTVRDAAWLMTTLSDNTATNLVLDRIGIRTVWAKMESLGLAHTKVHAKVFKRETTTVAPDSSAKYGLGVSTPNEMAHLFELLASGRAVSARADSIMLDMLEHNTDDALLQRYAGGVRAAHKTGAVDDARTECSLFYLRSRVIACVFTKENVDQRWVIDNEAQLLLATFGAAIVRAWPGPDAPQ